MALLSRNSPMQQRPATILGRPSVLLFRFPEHIGECGWCVSAKLSPAAPGTDDIYSDACARDRGQDRKLASRKRFEKFGYWIPSIVDVSYNWRAES
jgi:hypothetical protein